MNRAVGTFPFYDRNIEVREEEGIRLDRCYCLFDRMAFIFVEFVPRLRFQFESIIFFSSSSSLKPKKLCVKRRGKKSTTRIRQQIM